MDKVDAGKKAVESVVRYHQRTKHHLDRYARGPGQMDWANQPAPFRRFSGAPEIPLPLAADRQEALYTDLFTPGGIAPQTFSLESTATLLELSFGLSAWKSWGGDSWALRCNPSSGNLHPTECYLATSGMGGIDDGIYHYACRDHLLEQRCAVNLPHDGLLVGLSSIHWREAWKYGERAFRYCQHDIGHAYAALRYAAGVLGWHVRLLEDWGDSDLAALLGLDREDDFGAAEREVPDLLCSVGPDPGAAVDAEPMLAAVAAGQWRGKANALSGRHRYQWPVIEEVHEAAFKPSTREQPVRASQGSALLPITSVVRAADLIRQRRSAQDFDGVTRADTATLWRLLDATLPRPGIPPFDAWLAPPRVHLLLFIHRVDGLEPGMYFFSRRKGVAAEIRPEMRADFHWKPVAQCPAHLSVHQLLAGDCQRLATTVSCHQEIAGDSVLSLGMLAEFESALSAGSWWYRRLFWETGMIGQVLYLEAEAAGLRSTGIGCFFDDAVHDACGLSGTRFQSLYHFTLGGPRTDTRIQTLPPYGHLRRP